MTDLSDLGDAGTIAKNVIYVVVNDLGATLETITIYPVLATTGAVMLIPRHLEPYLPQPYVKRERPKRYWESRFAHIGKGR